MAAELARQREKPQCGFEVDIGRLQRTRQRHPLGLGLAVAFAELNVMAVRALLQDDRQPGAGVASERGFGRSVVGLAFDRERSGIAAARIIGAADKSAELAKLEAELAGAADRAY